MSDLGSSSKLAEKIYDFSAEFRNYYNTLKFDKFKGIVADPKIFQFLGELCHFGDIVRLKLGQI